MKTQKILPIIFFLLSITNTIAETLPPIGVKEIRTSHSTYQFPFLNSIELQSDDDDLTIFFDDTIEVDSFIFQLEGLDKEAITTSFPCTRYTNLTGNQYTFILSAKKDDCLSKPVRLHLNVLPKTTESHWFLPVLLIYIALVVGTITYFWSLYHYRQKMRLQNIRNQIASDLHDEVGSTLSSIAIFSKALKRNMQQQKAELIEILDNIIESAEHTNDNLHDTVWALNPNLDKAEDLFEKIRSMAFQVLTAKEIRLVFDADLTTLKTIKISMLQRRNIYMMVCEAINNIVKYSEATEVNIIVKKEGQKIRMKIEDNGIGFDEKAVSGNGLINFQRRSKESFIQFHLDTEIGKGTTINLLIPQL